MLGLIIGGVAAGIGAIAGGIIVSNRVKKARKRAKQDIDSILAKHQKILADNMNVIINNVDAKLTEQQTLFFSNMGGLVNNVDAKLTEQQTLFFSNMGGLVNNVDTRLAARIDQIDNATKERLTQLDKLLQDNILLFYGNLDTQRQAFFGDVNKTFDRVEELIDLVKTASNELIINAANVSSNLPLAKRDPIVLAEIITPLVDECGVKIHCIGVNLANAKNKLVIEGKKFELWKTATDSEIVFRVPFKKIPSLARLTKLGYPLAEIKHIKIDKKLFNKDAGMFSSPHSYTTRLTVFPLIAAVLKLKFTGQGDKPIIKERLIGWHQVRQLELRELLEKEMPEGIPPGIDMEVQIIRYDHKSITIPDEQINSYDFKAVKWEFDGQYISISPNKSLILE